MDGAAFTKSFPGWDAVMMHVPAPFTVTAFPEIAHTFDGPAVKLTAMPVVAVALRIWGASPTSMLCT